MKAILLVTLLLTSFTKAALSSEILKDFDSLGGNSDLYKKAKALSPELRTQVIQNRVVNRRMRLEIAPTFTTYWGGNPYISSKSAGMELAFHITPRWSVDLAYSFAFQNNLTDEGLYFVARAEQNNTSDVPDVDAPKGSILGFLTYYPFYGKLNMFDNIVHFDIYTSLGAGTTELATGNQATVGANFGMGIWWSQHLSTRFGYRFQNYEAQPKTGPQDINMSSAFLSMGYLL